MNLKYKRLFAAFIDYMIITVFSFRLQLIQIFINNKIINSILLILWIIFVFVLIPRKDYIFGCGSLGKQALNLGIYKNNKKVTDKKILRRRTYISLLFPPFYLISVVFFNKSIGDEMYGTKVEKIGNEVKNNNFNKIDPINTSSINNTSTKGKGIMIDFIILFVFAIFLYFFIYYSFEWFHWSRNVYSFIILGCIPFVWGTLICSIFGKKTLGQRIANRLNNKKEK